MTRVQSIKANILKVPNLNVKAKNVTRPSFTSNMEMHTSNPLKNFLDTQAAMNKSLVKTSPIQATTIKETAKVQDKKVENKPAYKNNFRSMLQNGEAKILAIVPRTFNAKDENGDEKITGNEQHGTFLNAIDRLDEVKAEGFNAFHILPIHPTGKQHAMGLAGSIYSPLDFLQIDPNLIDKKDKRTPVEQVKAFTDACHERGIKVMLDLPSCSSYDLYLQKP